MCALAQKLQSKHSQLHSGSGAAKRDPFAEGIIKGICNMRARKGDPSALFETYLSLSGAYMKRGGMFVEARDKQRRKSGRMKFGLLAARSFQLAVSYAQKARELAGTDAAGRHVDERALLAHEELNYAYHSLANLHYTGKKQAMHLSLSDKSVSGMSRKYLELAEKHGEMRSELGEKLYL